MISKKRFAEIEAELKDIQKGCSARVYNIEEIAQIIEEAELKIKKFPRWMFPYLTFSQTKAATINYFGSPQATYISIIFHKSGTAKILKSSVRMQNDSNMEALLRGLYWMNRHY